MKRIHIGLAVKDLDQSVAYYTALFGEGPVRREADYAKWTPAEPAVNLSVTTRGGGGAGPVHFGIDVSSKEELGEISDRLDAGGVSTVDEGDTICCYHRSTKTWAADPDQFAWEVFFTSQAEKEFGQSAVSLPSAGDAEAEGVCCGDSCCSEESTA